MIYLIYVLMLIFIYMHIETRLLSIKNINLHNLQSTKNIKPIKIMQISDVHICKMYISTKKIKKAIKNSNPDIIIFTGDYFESSSQISDFLNFLDEIIFNETVFLGLGNHDHSVLKNKFSIDSFKKDLASRNIELLINKTETISLHNRVLNITGIADITQNPDVETIFENFNKISEFSLVFSHNPDMLLQLPPDNVDLFISGHFHGGQIWMPFDFEFKLLRKEKVIDLGFKRGFHTYKGMNLYINKGIGNVMFPFRLFSVPEITVFHI